ncbi:N-acyl-D-amino-acid deacylase family protein, partial [Phenylobacterium sp.]|uniref:N-acyl-D-amino-acid deacylase family protein n=1 Tax=Phenylobacterium sp. TaxID=1871053 RepID=UPI002FDAB447
GVSGQALAQAYDVLIRGGTVYDGTGAAGVVTDLAIEGDRIVLVGQAPEGATARQVIDATGMIVSPGFIDPHSHAAPEIETPELAAAVPILHQGITTVFINPDGGGPADLKPQIEAIQALTPGVNVAPMIGHNGVRRAVMNFDNRKPTAAELARMEALVREAMELGAYGFSSGPFYVPGKYSDTDEIAALAKVAAAFPHAFHTSHIRDESSYDVGVLASVAEVIEVTRRTGIIGIVTHMKMLGPSVWGLSDDAVRMIDEARAQGLPIWADQYPYAASSTGLSAALVPGWAQEGGREALAARLQNPEQRGLIRKEMAENLERRAGANAIMISSYGADRSLEGLRLDEIARRNLQDPLDTAIDLLIKGNAGIVSFNMNEKDVELLMRQPWMMTSSDGALPRFGDGAEHPRAYGAFPRKLRRYVIEREVIDWAQAIHSSTGLSAEVLAIPDRGVLREGAFADVLVIDPETIRDVATYQEPHAYSEGMVHVFVNGKPAITDRTVTDQRHGRVLLRER